MLKIVTAAVLALGLAMPALANESEAETCLRNKVWDGYSDGWGIRTMTEAEIPTGRTKNYLVTLYKGNEYKVITCGDPLITNLDVLLYDSTGNLVARDKTTDREPMVRISPDRTGSYYVVMYLREVAKRKKSATAAMAVVYK